MSNMRYYLLLMVLYLGIVAGVFTLLYTPLRSAFMANWGFNSLILAALVACWQCMQMRESGSYRLVMTTGSVG